MNQQKYRCSQGNVTETEGDLVLLAFLALALMTFLIQQFI